VTSVDRAKRLCSVFVEHSDSMTLDTSTLHCAVYVLQHCNSMKSFTHEGGGGRGEGDEVEREKEERRRWVGRSREGRAEEEQCCKQETCRCGGLLTNTLPILEVHP